MPTGTEMYKALETATKGLDPGAEFHIHPVDVYDLFKLKPSDLIALGYDKSRAEEVSYALFKANCDPLGDSLGIRLVKDQKAPRLIAN